MCNTYIYIYACTHAIHRKSHNHNVVFCLSMFKLCSSNRYIISAYVICFAFFSSEGHWVDKKKGKSTWHHRFSHDVHGFSWIFSVKTNQLRLASPFGRSEGREWGTSEPPPPPAGRRKRRPPFRSAASLRRPHRSPPQAGPRPRRRLGGRIWVVEPYPFGVIYGD